MSTEPVCTYETCDHNSFRRGLCEGHYNQVCWGRRIGLDEDECFKRLHRLRSRGPYLKKLGLRKRCLFDPCDRFSMYGHEVRDGDGLCPVHFAQYHVRRNHGMTETQAFNALFEIGTKKSIYRSDGPKTKAGRQKKVKPIYDPLSVDTCSIEDCDRPEFMSKLCGVHYRYSEHWDGSIKLVYRKRAWRNGQRTQHKLHYPTRRTKNAS